MKRHWRLGFAVALIQALVPSGESMAGEHVLIDPGSVLGTAKRVDFVGSNEFVVERIPEGTFLRSTPKNSASGLYRRLSLKGKALENVQWTWRVDSLQGSADLRTLAREDAGAAVFFIFGEPSKAGKDVPTLAYVWSATPVPDGTIMQSVRYKSLRYIQLRGAPSVGNWQHETRNVAKDFSTIFGRKPGRLRYVAVFADNDQTGEPASALFGKITGSK